MGGCTTALEHVRSICIWGEEVITVKFRIITHEGPGCPTCDRPLQFREHASIGPKQLRGAWYYSRWYVCVRGDCPTTRVHAERFRVRNTQVERREANQELGK
jgi:hypothetical protein